MKKAIKRNITEEEISRTFRWFKMQYFPKPKTRAEWQEFLNDWVNYLVEQLGLIVIEDGRVLSEEELKTHLEIEVREVLKIELNKEDQ